MFKEPAYWMYYFWNKNRRAHKDGTFISDAMWTMALLWLFNLLTFLIAIDLWSCGAATGWLFDLMGMVEWSKFNPAAYLWVAVVYVPLLWICRKLYYQPSKLKAMQEKYGTMGKERKLTGQCLFWLYVCASLVTFFVTVNYKHSSEHPKEQTLIERLQEIREGKYPVEWDSLSVFRD